MQDRPQALLDNARWLGLLPDAERAKFRESWLRLSSGSGPTPELAEFGQRLDQLWKEAKATKDFSAVDTLKSALIAAGVEVRMSKAGVELVPGPDFDPAKLKALQ
jgi:cysteinyl-tRNA synthetase